MHSPHMENADISDGRRRLIAQRRERSKRHTVDFDELDRRGKQRSEQEKWVRERVKVIGVDADQILSGPRRRMSQDSGIWVEDEPEEVVEVSWTKARLTLVGRHVPSVLPCPPSSAV